MAITGTNKATGTSTTSVTSISTGSWTPTANRLAIAWVHSDKSNSTNPVAPTSVTGNGLTWSLVTGIVLDTQGTHRCRIDCYVALTGSTPSAGATTADWNGVAQGGGAAIIVDEFSGVDVSGTALAAIVQSVLGPVDTVGSPCTLTLGSAITSGNATAGFFCWLSGNSIIPGSGYTQLGQVVSGNNESVMSEWRQTGITTVDATRGAQVSSGIGIEIKAAVVPPEFTIDTDFIKVAAALNAAQSLTETVVSSIKKATASIQLSQAISDNEVWVPTWADNEVWVDTWE